MCIYVLYESYVLHDSFTYEGSRALNMSQMNQLQYTHVWKDVFLGVTGLNSYVLSFTYEGSRALNMSQTNQLQYTCVLHDSFTYEGSRALNMSQMNQLQYTCVLPDSFTYEGTRAFNTSQMNQLQYTYEWVTAQAWRTYKWVMAHVRMSHGTHVNEQVELPAKLLDHFIWSNKNNINQKLPSQREAREWV